METTAIPPHAEGPSGFPMPLLDLIKVHRSDIQETAIDIKNLKTHPGVKDAVDQGEVMANLTIAYRCLEDARMRLGKVYEAYEGQTNSTR